MKVSELIKLLQELNPDAQVIMQRDAEGNGYSPLSDVDGDAIYVAETTYSGDVYSTKWTSDEACMAPGQWEEFKRDNHWCVVLAPVN